MEDFVVTLLVILGAAGFLALVQGALRPQERSIAWLGFVAHIVATIVQVMLTRDVLGGGDLLNYYNIGSAIAERLSEDFEDVAPNLLQTLLHQPIPLPVPAHGAGTATGAMNALSGFLIFFGARSVYAACAVIGFAGFFASLAMYLSIRDELPESSWLRVLAGCLLVPSVVFWSSALLKESVALSGLCLMVVGGQWITRHRRFLWGTLVLLLGASIVGLLKAYILVPFGVAAGAWFYMVAFQKQQEPVLKGLTVLLGSCLAVGLIWATGTLFPQYSIGMFADEAAHHQEVGARFSGAADYTLDPDFAGEVDSPGVVETQAQLAPLALVTALFRPFVFEAGNAQMFVNALETSAMLWLFILSIYRCGVRGFLRRLSDNPLLVFCLIFVLGLGVGVGLATTNLGTLSRYRMPLMPFFAILLLELSRREEQQAAHAVPQPAT